MEPEVLKTLKCKTDKAADLKEVLIEILYKIQEAELGIDQSKEIEALKIST